MVRSILLGALLALLLGSSFGAKAIYCDYCSGSGSWECRAGYIEYPDTGGRFYAGSVCTYFYSAGGYESPSEYYDFWDRSYAGGGAFRFATKYVIPHLIDNPYPATCHSSVEARLDAANFDVAKRQAAALTSGSGVAKAGELVRVSYDDDSWEIWQITMPLSSEPIDVVPIRGPFNCND